MKWLVVCIGVLAGIVPEAVCAQCPLDQVLDSVNPSLGSSGVGGPTDKAQTFTVGRTGSLTGIEIYIQQNIPAGDDLIIDVRVTAAGVPIENDATTLAVRTIPFTSVPASYAYLFVDLSADNISVTAGDVLAIVLRAPPYGSTDYSLSTTESDYAAGVTFYRNPEATSTTWTPSGGDFGFKTHVCSPVPVEDQTWGSVKSVYR